MKQKRLLNLIVVLGLLMSFVVTMLHTQPAALAALAAPRQVSQLDSDSLVKPVADGPIYTTLPPDGAAMNVLYPEDMDPPETCGVPLRGPFGQDVEILVGPTWPRVTYQISPNPGWYNQQGLPGSAATSDIAVVAQGSEQIVAIWAGAGGALFYNIWSAGSGWGSAQTLELTPGGNPALLSRNAYNWVVFARVGGSIKYREWNYGTLGAWLDLPGLTGSASAASDPVVISIAPDHMAVFYRDENGGVWFTEATTRASGTGDLLLPASAQELTTLWRAQPVSLSDAEWFFELYLPLLAKSASGVSLALDATAHQPALPQGESGDPFTLVSDLSVVSRQDNHLAVFGVDANHQLWVKEWTNLNESDWSDTAWVKLMDNVMVERPAVASRHSNHLGLAVRNTSGVPYYIEWTYAAGWKTPVSLGGTRSSPLTIAAPSVSVLAVFSVEGGQIWHKDWNETEGWGIWQAFTDTNAKNGQILAATARQTDDLMLLGRRLDGTGFYKHFTSLGQNLKESVVAPVTVSAHPGVQALAWVDGTTLWVGGSGWGENWEINALALTAGITATLALPTHPMEPEQANGVLAAGDLDFDGDDEIVIATTTTQMPTLTISVLNFAVSPTLAISLTSTITLTVPENTYMRDLAIGDLDGDGRQNEVALTYGTDWTNDLHISVFEYITTTNKLEYRGHKLFTAPRPGFGWGTIRTAIGHVYDRHPVYGRLSGEQLIVAAAWRSDDNLTHYVRTEVYSMTFTSPGWSFVDLDAVEGPDYDGHQPLELTLGDLNADGLDEIVYTRPGAAYVIGYDRESGARQQVSFDPGNANAVNDFNTFHSVGDLDMDGKAEIAYWTQDNRVAILELVDENTLHLLGSISPTELYGELLIGDLDGDSFLSELVGCTSFSEVSVIAVLNGAPRVYAGGQPVQDTDVRYAQTATGGSSSAWGTTTKQGSFLSVGFENEISVFGWKLGEVRGSVTRDFMASQGQTRAVEESVTLSSGYNNQIGTTLGIVVYNGTDYRCYYYDLYSSATPAQRSRAMICRPIGNSYENFYSLEQWHSASFKQQAGTSWVDVGHRTASGVRTNEVTSYPGELPVDPYLLKHMWPTQSSFLVNYDVSGGYTDWSISDMMGQSQESSRSFETNTTVSVGATVGSVTIDTGFTEGFGWEESRSVSWSDELEIGGAVYKISDPAFQTCRYRVLPYIYHAKGTSLAGVTYPYLEMDYFVPWLEGNCTAVSMLNDRVLSR